MVFYLETRPLSQRLATDSTGGVPSQQKNSLLETLRSILNLTQDRQQQALLWKERTGKSSAAFYRYLRELGHKEGASMRK